MDLIGSVILFCYTKPSLKTAVTLKRIVIALLSIGALGVGAFPLLSAPDLNTSDEPPATLLRDDIDQTSEFMITTWKTGDGLPVNEIQELKKTPDGYLWMGSHQGLIRFDGARFETFYNTPTGPRIGTHMGPLELDALGRLWIAPDQAGLIRRDATGFTEVLTNGSVKARVVSLCTDTNKNIVWVDVNGGVGRFSIEAPHKAEQLSDVEASSASRWVRDFEGNLWLAGARNLKIYENEKWRDIATPGTATLMAAPRQAGGMWIAREAKLRIVTANGVTRDIATFPWAGLSRVTCLFEDSRQRVWIGTLGQGLFCYVGGEFKQVVPTASSISCLLEDEQENLWVGTRGSGLVRVRQRQFFMHDIRSGLRNEFVRSLSQDKAGRVWLVTADGGLGWWQNGVWHGLGETDGWRSFDSLCVLPVNDGSVWISTIHRGLWHWSNGKLSRRDLGPKGPTESVMDLLEDRQNRLWMVTDNSGIYCLEKNNLKRYSVPEGLPSEHIRRMVEDDAGNLWASDWEGAVARFKNERWEVVRKASGHADAVRAMVAHDGALWLGTSGGGLLRVKNGQTTRISQEQGLPDVCIQQLLLDKNFLWGGTPHRLFRMTLTQLNAVADGHGDKVDAITYGRSDGLPDVSFASWCDPRCWRAQNGELWFATANGAIHFKPEDLPESKPPQALLEQTLLNGKPVTKAELQRLRPGPAQLEFRFTAPCLTAPERVRFRYQMSGLDAAWVDAGTTRSVNYASIPAGDHVVRVIACSPEGVWSSQPAMLALAVHPYYWQTNWFLAAVAAALAGGGVWMIRRATVLKLRRRVEVLRQQQALDRERARIAQDIHDELGANLTSIGLMADMGARHKSDPVAVARELDQISETARESVAAMDAIVWALNPRNDSVDNFANYVAQFTRDFFRPTELRTRLELPANLPSHPLAMETRHQLLLIVKECFNNVVRHAKATEVYLELACDDSQLRLTIADDGRGLFGKAEGEGHDGLANLRERIERLGGTLAIQSKKGKGTRLDFTVPLPKVKSN
ncbi:MAG: hypothetical protein JWM68_1001 [Verrucomicrobiales bacterium]|nr:hypothetical protein [Verrucomicrobiales bacterium]